MWYYLSRKYAEFYVLEQKLTEFHGEILFWHLNVFLSTSTSIHGISISCMHTFVGEFDDAILPPKKLVGTRNQEFLESKRIAFEQYLQVSLISSIAPKELLDCSLWS